MHHFILSGYFFYFFFFCSFLLGYVCCIKTPCVCHELELFAGILGGAEIGIGEHLHCYI